MTNLEKARCVILKHPKKIDNNTNCILSTTCIQANGYTKIRFNRKYIYLHRLVAFAYLGLDLSNTKIMVLHKRECPNRHCFNKDHLYLGSAVDNANDYIALGRHHEVNNPYCDKGHLRDKLIYSKRDGLTKTCSICRREAQKRLNNRKRGLV